MIQIQFILRCTFFRLIFHLEKQRIYSICFALRSCMDLINGAHASGGFERASDFVVSLTLPLTPSERQCHYFRLTQTISQSFLLSKVIKRLSKPTQDALYREGLIHFLPKEVQTALFPEVLFVPSFILYIHFQFSLRNETCQTLWQTGVIAKASKARIYCGGKAY